MREIERAQHQKEEKMDHFSHKHPLTLIQDEKEQSKFEYRPYLRCYGCTEKIGSGVQYYRCQEGCPLFCLHHACTHLPTTIKQRHSFRPCDGELQLKRHPDEVYFSCFVCYKTWYSFAYVCSDCGKGVDVRCATRRPNGAKHSFHQHPVQPCFSPRAGDLICSVCTRIITPSGWGKTHDICLYYKCNYCNFIVHPQCTDVPLEFQSPSHPHKLILDFQYDGSQTCKICHEDIDRTTQWAYKCGDCWRYYIHAANENCLISTIRKDDLLHFDHRHPLALVDKQEAPPPALDSTYRPVAKELYCHCCGQKISPSDPYYTCVHCNSYHLHQLCSHLPREVQHHLHPKCPLELWRWPSAVCDVCHQKSSGFFYKCYPCNFKMDIGCALRTQRTNTIFHKHPLFLSHTKAPFNCHACDRDTPGSSYQCISCQFWLHHQCASLPALKETSSHEHNLELVYTIPKKYSGVVVYCRICTKALKDHRWAYHCNQCRYLTHIYDCSDPYREGDGVTIDPSEVVHLPLAGEPIFFEEKLTNGKMNQHHRHSMILFADEFESNAIDITPSFANLIRGSTTWQTFNVDGKHYSGTTFSFDNEILTMQATGVDLPRFVKHESHPHVLKSTFLNSSTWCHACEQTFFGRGFQCTTCAFTIDTYCALLPKMIKHRYDKHGFSLTYSAIEGIEEYVCEICEKDVTPRYFYHCVACDQSIHARCIWKAYVQFKPRYRIHCVRQLGFLVPPSQALPQCIICGQKETFSHGFAFLIKRPIKQLLVHLTCLSEDDVQI